MLILKLSYVNKAPPPPPPTGVVFNRNITPAYASQANTKGVLTLTFFMDCAVYTPLSNQMSEMFTPQ